jgi:hypothetical protein
MLRERTLTHPADFIEPCLPRPANSPPSGPKWIHEIKHDGYRIMAQRADGRREDAAAQMSSGRQGQRVPRRISTLEGAARSRTCKWQPLTKS